MVVCDICHLRYSGTNSDPDIRRSENRAHRKFHQNWVEAMTFWNGYNPMAYHTREKVKHDARQRLRDARSQEKVIEAFLMVVRCYFDRSLEAAYCDGKPFWTHHPPFETYLLMFRNWRLIICSHGEQSPEMYAQVRDRLIHQYGDPELVEFPIPDGFTYWEPTPKD